jgi:hypothetical protein
VLPRNRSASAACWLVSWAKKSKQQTRGVAFVHDGARRGKLEEYVCIAEWGGSARAYEHVLHEEGEVGHEFHVHIHTYIHTHAQT